MNYTIQYGQILGTTRNTGFLVYCETIIEKYHIVIPFLKNQFIGKYARAWNLGLGLRFHTLNIFILFKRAEMFPTSFQRKRHTVVFLLQNRAEKAIYLQYIMGLICMMGLICSRSRVSNSSVFLHKIHP